MPSFWLLINIYPYLCLSKGSGLSLFVSKIALKGNAGVNPEQSPLL